MLCVEIFEKCNLFLNKNKKFLNLQLFYIYLFETALKKLIEVSRGFTTLVL